MQPVSFLINRQLGINIKSKFPASNFRLNTDFLLSRFTCLRKNVFITLGEGEETDVPPFSCKFRKDDQSDLLAVANEDGFILLYDTSDSCSKNLLKAFPAHNNAVFDICWLPDKCQLIAASGDHKASLWDIMTCQRISLFRKHTASIKSVDVCHQQSAMFATGSRDGTINIWDLRENNSALNDRPAITICSAHQRKYPMRNGKKQGFSDAFNSVSAIAFQDNNYLASSGVADGVVKVWDLRKTYVTHPKFTPMPKYQMKYSESKRCTSLVFDSTYKNLYACSTGHKIYKFDCHSYMADTNTFEGFRCCTYFVKLAISNDDQYLLCGSSDDKAYIWKTSKPGLPLLELSGHSAEVTSVAWSPNDNTKIATCGDDNRVLIWKMANLENTVQEEVFAVSSAYSGNLKSDSPESSNSDESLLRINSSVDEDTSRRSPANNNHTPVRKSLKVITSFFSPVTPSRNAYNHLCNINSNVVVTPQTPLTTSSNILQPLNITNKCNILQSLGSSGGKQTSPTKKNMGNINSFLNIQNKENTESDSSPESLTIGSKFGQIKRKSSVKSSTPKLKKLHSDSCKIRGSSKVDKKAKAIPGRTIMNYFSVVSSTEN